MVKSKHGFFHQLTPYLDCLVRLATVIKPDFLWSRVRVATGSAVESAHFQEWRHNVLSMLINFSDSHFSVTGHRSLATFGSVVMVAMEWPSDMDTNTLLSTSGRRVRWSAANFGKLREVRIDSVWLAKVFGHLFCVVHFWPMMFGGQRPTSASHGRSELA